MLKVRQWIPLWDSFDYSSNRFQSKPKAEFYVGALAGKLLRRLSDVQRRSATIPRQEDTGIQRAHVPERSAEIARYIEGGFPWATLGRAERDQHKSIRKPGWLPGAVVANIAPDNAYSVRIEHEGAHDWLVLPDGSDDPHWELDDSAPLQIIDGQHRLLAFDELDGEDYELPVVLFDGLDVGWQAYLFWTINVTPKRISPSFAFDLYPLLRTQEWLQDIGGPLTYRETRAQELTEVLWGHPASPWRNRIGMLGRERGKVSQAAFVRSLTLSFVRPSDASSRRTGGLFGAPLNPDGSRPLGWTRAQQAAYLIVLWKTLADAVAVRGGEWAQSLREWEDSQRPSQRSLIEPGETLDPAFAGELSILSTDQGVRGFLQVANDISFANATTLAEADWLAPRNPEPLAMDEVTEQLDAIESFPSIVDLARSIADATATFDWRSAAFKPLEQQQRERQSLYKGGTGYRQVRQQLLLHIANGGSPLAACASELVQLLGYE